ncbi:hypothetical protein BX666DRAFT_1217219 [Dichotomocladium elegans]|nr:hypothetical protein BX666DRAFT_1217219 [Dichotomocladium elegans]
MTQHLGHQHLSAQTFSAYDPAAPIYCSSVTPAPEHYAYQYHHHHYQPLQHQHQQLQQELQFNYHRLSAHIHPQHQEEALRLHQLQQDAMLQQQQAMYHQQILAYQQQQSHYQANQSRSPTKRMQTKADRRAEHNAIERLRRENLNSKFQQLAHSLPNLQNERRPSKGTIIERTLDFGKLFP